MKSNRRIGKTNLQKASDVPWVDVSFCSCLEKAQQVEDQVLTECQKKGYGEHAMFALKLAIEEALVNAVKHGNKMEMSKHVKVQYRVTPDRADIAIEDEGPGFNPAEVPDCLADENLESNHGRGILLMRTYMSSVVFSPSGNKVTLTKFNDNMPDEAAGRKASFG